MVYLAGNKMHRTGADAAAAADAGGVCNALVLLVSENKDAVRTLYNGNIEVVNRDTHHGAAHKHFLGIFGQAACRLDELTHGSAYTHAEITGVLYAGAGDGDYSVYSGHAGFYGSVNGPAGVVVENDAANVGGQTAGRYLSAGDGLYELLFGALRISGLLYLEANVTVFVGKGFAQLFDGLLLVVFDNKGGVGQLEKAHQHTHALNDLVGVLKHDAVVCGYIGFALRGIYDEVIRLAQTTGDLDRGGERGTAHADNTGAADYLGECFGVCFHLGGVGDDTGIESVLHVIIDNYGLNHFSIGMEPGLNGGYRAGNACMNIRRNGGRCLGNDLAEIYMVANIYNGLTGGAYVQHNGHENLLGSGKHLYGTIFGKSFAFVRVNAAEKLVGQFLHPFTNLNKIQQLGLKILL